MSIRSEARKLATQKYLERLTELNTDADSKTVLDSIDRPMRELILEIHRIGGSTTFCCCGFPYETEEEPKSHHANLTYVFIRNKATNEQGKNNIVEFINTLTDEKKGKNRWKMVLYKEVGQKPNSIFHLYYNSDTFDIYEHGEDELAIHDYEIRMMMIKQAVDVAKKLPTVNETVTIRDGNHAYFENGYSEWQIEPRQDFVANIEEVTHEIK
tara:strand:- start:26226 stop:26861 length:636 start_codon:yes stop_codon:yes gene_type:complete